MDPRTLLDMLTGVSPKNVGQAVKDLKAGTYAKADVKTGTALPPASGVMGKIVDVLGGLSSDGDASVLQALTAWKKKGLSKESLEQVMKMISRPVKDKIQKKDSMFHATTPENAQQIIQDKQIKVLGVDNPSPTATISMSRQPVIPNFGMDTTYEHPVRFEIDPQQVPGSKRPTVWNKNFAKSSDQFEYETRTNKPIPMKAVKSVWVTEQKDQAIQQLLDSVVAMANNNKIPVKQFKTVKDVVTGRVK